MTTVRLHVVPHGGAYIVEHDNGERFGQFPTEALAEVAAKNWVRSYGDGEVVIHMDDGVRGTSHRSSRSDDG